MTKIDAPSLKGRKPLGVFLWMVELKKAGLLWHMDDDPHDCSNFTEPQKYKLQHEQRKAWEICTEAGADIHLLALTALGDDFDARSYSDQGSQLHDLCRETAELLGKPQEWVTNKVKEGKKP